MKLKERVRNHRFFSSKMLSVRTVSFHTPSDCFQLIAHKLATKAQLEMEMADFHLEQKKREHELFFEVSLVLCLVSFAVRVLRALASYLLVGSCKDAASHRKGAIAKRSRKRKAAMAEL